MICMEEQIESAKIKNKKLVSEIEELKFQLSAEKMCNEARLVEIDNLRGKRRLEQLDLVIFKESQASIACTNQLLVAEIDKKNVSIKSLEKTIEKQKRELKNLMTKREKELKAKVKKVKKVKKDYVSSPIPVEKDHANSPIPVVKDHVNSPIPVVANGRVNEWSTVNKIKKKNKLYVRGDESVRNLSQEACLKPLDTQVTVRGGCTAGRATHLTLLDSKDIPVGSTVVFCYGAHDLRMTNSERVKERMDRLINSAESLNDCHNQQTNIALLAIPPQEDELLNREAQSINSFLWQRLSRSTIHLIDPHLEMRDLGRDGIQLKPAGRRKVGRAVLQFARNVRSTQYI